MVWAGAALAWAIGWFLVRAFWPAGLRARTRGLRCVLALGVGAGVVSLVHYASLWFAGGASIAVLVAAEGALLAGLALGAHRPRAVTPAPAAPLAPPAPRATGLVALAALFTVAALAAVAVFVLAASLEPHGSADAQSIWNLRAKHLFAGGPTWRAAVAASPHADYPQLLPGLIARTWHFTAEPTMAVPAVIAAVFPAAIVALLVAGLAALRDARTGLCAGGALLACPAFTATAPMQYADLPLAFFVLATLVVLAVHDHHRLPGRRLLVLAGACLGLGVWTKNEGVLFAVVLLAARAFAARTGGLRRIRRELEPLLLGAAPSIAAWSSVKLLLAPPNDLVAQVAAGKAAARIVDPDRYVEIARAFALELWHLGPLLLTAVAAWACLHRTGRLRLALAVAALMLAGDAFVYLCASQNLSWHLATSLQRLMLQVLPLALLGVFAATRTAPPPATSSPPSACSDRS